MPVTEEPRFVNNNPFAVQIQDPKGRTIMVQPFVMRSRVRDEDCVMVGEFYRRYNGPKGPLWPFPGSAVAASGYAAAANAAPVVESATPRDGAGAPPVAGAGSPADVGGKAEKTPVVSPPQASRVPKRGPTAGGKQKALESKLDPVGFGWLKQSVVDAARDDVTNDDVQTMVDFILHRRAKRSYPLPDRLGEFANDLNDIAAGRNPHRAPVTH